MRNSFDPRGSRRLSILCDFIGQVFGFFLATSKGTVVLWTPFFPQETAYSPSSFSKLKSCIPACLKTKSPSRGIEISGLAIIRVIGIPLVVAAADIATDSNLLFDMSYLWNDLFFDNYGDSGDNVT